MKSIFFLVFAWTLQLAALQTIERNGFQIEPNAAQSKGSDYTNVVRVERGISLAQAFDIAEADPEIDYFVYLKGGQMVLEVPPNVTVDLTKDPFHLLTYSRFRYDSGSDGQGYCRIFRHGDTVFFKKEGMQLGTAPGLADAYLKVTP